MNHTGCSSLALFLLLSGVAAAGADPAQTAASPAPPAAGGVPASPSAAQDWQSASGEVSADTLANAAQDATAAQPTAPPLPPPSRGVSPDPAASSVGMEWKPVQLPAAVPPEDSCDTADCAAPADKSAGQGAKKNPPVHIGPPAQRSLAESHSWAEDPNAMPTRDTAGRVIYTFSESAPTIVCAPLHVCDIELQEGELVQGAPHVGDSVRWKISPALSGSDEKRVTHLIVKPTESGLDTNLVVPTDRHTYHIRLVSSTSRYVTSVGFSYPEEQQQVWTEFSKATGARAGGSSEMPTVAVNRLNFDYRIKVAKGKPSFKPLRAMDDGYHTYIFMNEDLVQREAPVLLGLSPGGQEQMLNYRLKGNLYIIDGTVFKLALVAGVGRDQQRIELTRDPCKRRGWLGVCWDEKE
jgi:type IV secretion system protein VirB9